MKPVLLTVALAVLSVCLPSLSHADSSLPPRKDGSTSPYRQSSGCKVPQRAPSPTVKAAPAPAPAPAPSPSPSPAPGPAR